MWKYHSSNRRPPKHKMQHNQTLMKAPQKNKNYNCVLCYTYNLCFVYTKTRHLMTLAYEFLLLDASLQLPRVTLSSTWSRACVSLQQTLPFAPQPLARQWEPRGKKEKGISLTPKINIGIPSNSNHTSKTFHKKNSFFTKISFFLQSLPHIIIIIII
jgi:hypothetical protein